MKLLSRADTALGSGSPVVDALRTILVRHGLVESHSLDDEGFYITAEDHDEVCVQFHELERDGASTTRATTGRNEAALLALCDILARGGYTLTLFMSPRSLALFVRADESVRRGDRRP